MALNGLKKLSESIQKDRSVNSEQKPTRINNGIDLYSLVRVCSL